jgi:hypothetical protein
LYLLHAPLVLAKFKFSQYFEKQIRSGTENQVASRTSRTPVIILLLESHIIHEMREMVVELSGRVPEPLEGIVPCGGS